MQDEVNTKVVAIMIKGGKISAEVLKKALDKFVQEIEKAQKQMQHPKTYRGKQSIKHLMSQNAAISNIEVTDGNIKSFERTASKYGLDFAQMCIRDRSGAAQASDLSQSADIGQTERAFVSDRTDSTPEVGASDEAAFSRTGPVSYTHLDVYKRPGYALRYLYRPPDLWLGGA